MHTERFSAYANSTPSMGGGSEIVVFTPVRASVSCSMRSKMRFLSSGVSFL